MNSHLAQETMKLIGMENLSKNVSKLVLGVNMQSLENPNLNLLSNDMTINLNMFGALMVDWVCCNVESSLVVTVKNSWPMMGYLQVVKKRQEPQNLTSSVGHGSVLGFSR